MSLSQTLSAATGRRWRLVQRAPVADLPTTRDRAGAQAGMLIALGVGALFWGALAALALA